jgi:hypothetical protein
MARSMSEVVQLRIWLFLILWTGTTVFAVADYSLMTGVYLTFQMCLMS